MSRNDELFPSFDFFELDRITENYKESEAMEKSMMPLESEWNAWEVRIQICFIHIHARSDAPGSRVRI